MTMFVIVGAVAVVLFMLVSAAVKIVQEYERGVIFRLGRLVAARGPGFFLLIPFVETMRKVDLRIVTLEVPAQEAITRDNVTIEVDAVVYFRVVDPSEAVDKAIDFVRATSLVGQTTLRSILGQSDLDHSVERARQDQSATPGSHRPTDEPVGSKSDQRRSARYPAAPDDAAGDG